MDRENRIGRETGSPAQKDRCCHFLGLVAAGSESLEVNTSPRIRAEARDVKGGVEKGCESFRTRVL